MKSIGIEAISYVGTTLLSMILGSHPHCRSVGHCYVFFEPYRKRRKDIISKENVCEVCSLLGKDCDLNTLKNLEGNRASAQYAYDIIRDLVLHGGDEIIIDSSTTTPWFNESGPDRIIWLFRDPVTLMSSYFKSLGHKSYLLNYMCNAYVKKYSKASGLVIEYKNIVTNTLYLSGLFHKLGLGFLPDYLEYWNYSNHMVNGSTGTLINIARHKCPDKLDSVLGRVCKGNKEYEKYYRQSQGNFSGNISLLTKEEETYVLKKCERTYDMLRRMQEDIL